MFKKKFVVIALIFCFVFNNFSVVLAIETKFPNYANEFLGKDCYEKFNRKVFNFNLKLNKYALRPIHIIWSSIMPVYAMDRLHGISNNIEYPIRFFSCLIQKDFKTAGHETVRFLANSTIGLGGMFDVAKKIWGIEQVSENMEQALAGCKLKSGHYMVLPVISFTTPRGILGNLLDMAFNPSSYIATPVLAIIKAGLMINRTSYLQPWIMLVESTFADPYDVAKMAYGIDKHIKCNNFDRLSLNEYIIAKNVTPKISKTEEKEVKQNVVKSSPSDLVKIEVSSELVIPELLKGGANIDKTLESTENFKLTPDIILKDYNPQNPIVDSMRTSLFDIPEVNKSIWNEMSVWNRSFAQRIKTSSVNIYKDRPDYNFRYILQKGKNSPVAFVYPSVGEGIYSEHSVLLANILYKHGYSVVIQGSHFQWEFLKSMPKGYYPGLAKDDAKQLRLTSEKILEKLQNSKGVTFGDKLFIGTSFGAFELLYVANLEYVDNRLGNSKFIAICPPIEMFYAMKQVDKISDEWDKSSEKFKDKVGQTAAKVVKLYNTKDENKNMTLKELPFDEEEGKIITSFIMHQKLSDLLYTIENDEKRNENIYDYIHNVNFEDYANKYLVNTSDEKITDFSYEISLHSISDYLELNDNYRIYHSVNDYLTNVNQLKKLKQYTKNKTILFDNGAHLGFLYRPEFVESLNNTISEFK